MTAPQSGPCIRCEKQTTRLGRIASTRWCVGAEFFQCADCAAEHAREQAEDSHSKGDRR